MPSFIVCFCNVKERNSHERITYVASGDSYPCHYYFTYHSLTHYYKGLYYAFYYLSRWPGRCYLGYFVILRLSVGEHYEH